MRRRPAGDVEDLALARAKAEARDLVTRYPELRSQRTAEFLAGEGGTMPTARDLAHLTLRLPHAHVARLEALVPKIADAPELATVGRVTRSDVLRLAVLRGLAALEEEYQARAQGRLPGVEG